MATLASPTEFANVLGYKGGIGVNDNDVVVQTGDVSAYDTFTLMTTAGAADVFCSLDGTNYATAALSLEDLGATSAAGGVWVVVTAALRIYRFRGNFRLIQVQQNGATAVTGATLLCSKTHVAG